MLQKELHCIVILMVRSLGCGEGSHSTGFSLIDGQKGGLHDKGGASNVCGYVEQYSEGAAKRNK